MRQKPAVIRNIQRTFFLSETEVNNLLTAGVGEGILIMDDDHSEIKVIASPEEHAVITTKPDELLATSKYPTEEERLNEIQKDYDRQEKAKNKRQKIEINVDRDVGCVKLKELSKDEIDYLKNFGYKSYPFHSILSKRKERYLIELRDNESPQHIFLTHDIAEYIKKFTNKVETYQTVNPDVVFNINGVEYAIEVETGKMLKHNKKDLMNKVENLNKNYPDRWFFVVTDRNLRTSYAKIGQCYDKRHLTSVINRIVSKK